MRRLLHHRHDGIHDFETDIFSLAIIVEPEHQIVCALGLLPQGAAQMHFRVCFILFGQRIKQLFWLRGVPLEGEKGAQEVESGYGDTGKT